METQKLKGYIKENELWKPILGYEHRYMMSNKKRVKDILKNRILKQTILKSGSKSVALKNQLGKTSNRRVELIYAITFKGFKPNKNTCVSNDRIIDKRENQNKTFTRLKEYTNLEGVILNNSRGKLYKAVITINNKYVHLGMFDNEIDAHNIYKKAVKYMHLYKNVPKLFRELLNTIKY